MDTPLSETFRTAAVAGLGAAPGNRPGAVRSPRSKAPTGEADGIQPQKPGHFSSQLANDETEWEGRWEAWARMRRA